MRITETTRIVSDYLYTVNNSFKINTLVLGSSGQVIFTGLEGGRYILKIFAYNKLTDVATAKMVVNI